MSALEKLYDFLLAEPPEQTDRIFAAALLDAEEPYFSELANLLLHRQTEAGYAGLVACKERLNDAHEARLWERVDLVRAGAARAARWSLPAARLHAFRALAETPFIKLAYLIPDALRDPHEPVREIAADVFRKMAAHFLEHTVPPPLRADWRTSVDTDVRHFLDVVWQLFDKFDLHLRVEAFEITLWFARFFDDDLWAQLDTPRSNAGYVVREHLPAWDDPRLAGFLLLALRQQHWRRPAAHALAKWRSLPECRALLQNTDLLDEPEIARQIAIIKHAPWISTLQAHWDVLSPAEKRLVPRWMAVSAIDEDIRAEGLARLLHRDDEGLRRAALYALGGLPDPAAQRVLAQFGARGHDAAAHFASWIVIGREADIVAAPRREERRPPPRTPNGPDFGADDARKHQFSVVWQMLRRQELEPHREVVNDVRDHLEDWRALLTAQLRAPDPRERVLALRIIAAAGVTNAFQTETALAAQDPAPGVRALARRLVAGSATERVGGGR